MQTQSTSTSPKLSHKQVDTPRQSSAQNNRPSTKWTVIVDDMYSTQGLSGQPGLDNKECYKRHKDLLERICKQYEKGHNQAEFQKRVRKTTTRHVNGLGHLYTDTTPAQKKSVLSQLDQLGKLASQQASFLEQRGCTELANITTQLASRYREAGQQQPPAYIRQAPGVKAQSVPRQVIEKAKKFNACILGALASIGLIPSVRGQSNATQGTGSASGLTPACPEPLSVQPLPDPYPACGEFTIDIATQDVLFIVNLRTSSGASYDHVVTYTLGEQNDFHGVGPAPFSDLIKVKRTSSADQTDCLMGEMSITSRQSLDGLTITVRTTIDGIFYSRELRLPTMFDDHQVQDLMAQALECFVVKVDWEDNHENTDRWLVKSDCEEFVVYQRHAVVFGNPFQNQIFQVTPISCHGNKGRPKTIEVPGTIFPPCPEGRVVPSLNCSRDSLTPTPSPSVPVMTTTVTETETEACKATPWQSPTVMLPAAAAAAATAAPVFFALGLAASAVALVFCVGLLARAWYVHRQKSQRRRTSNVLPGASYKNRDNSVTLTGLSTSSAPASIPVKHTGASDQAPLVTHDQLQESNDALAEAQSQETKEQEKQSKETQETQI